MTSWSQGRNVPHMKSLSCQEGPVSGWAAMVLLHLPLPFLLLFSLTPLSPASPHGDPHTPHAAAGSILRQRPFVVVWNLPTAQCHSRFNIHLDLSAFDIVENREQRFLGQVNPEGEVLWPHFTDPSPLRTYSWDKGFNLKCLVFTFVCHCYK